MNHNYNVVTGADNSLRAYKINLYFFIIIIYLQKKKKKILAISAADAVIQPVVCTAFSALCYNKKNNKILI